MFLYPSPLRVLVLLKWIKKKNNNSNTDSACFYFFFRAAAFRIPRFDDSFLSTCWHILTQHFPFSERKFRWINWSSAESQNPFTLMIWSERWTSPSPRHMPPISLKASHVLVNNSSSWTWHVSPSPFKGHPLCITACLMKKKQDGEHQGRFHKKLSFNVCGSRGGALKKILLKVLSARSLPQWVS